MKQISTLLPALLYVIGAFAQTPEKMSYQAVVRDATEKLVANTNVGIQISILQGSSTGSSVYTETQTPGTNANGLISLEIGMGTSVNGDFATIDWSDGPYFIKTEIDPTGGTTYSITGISQMLSVPYALHAKTAENFTGSINELLPTEAEDGNLITFDGNNWIAKRALIENSGAGQQQNNMQPYIGINHIIALQGVYPSRNSLEPFLAEIDMFAGNFAPRGWALCDGQLLPIAENSALFSLLGTTYGGDGRSTFGLPDMRGRTAIHPGQGPGLSNRTLGKKGGSEFNIMTIDEMPQHNHIITYE